MHKYSIFIVLFWAMILFVACQPNTDATQSKKRSESKVEFLSSWNDTQIKQDIMSFVEGVSNKSSNLYVEPKRRVAVLDMDGTIWCEKPFFLQYQFVVDRMRYLSGSHPEWKKDPLLNAVLEGNIEVVKEYGWEGIMEVAVLTHTGMPTKEYEKLVSEWLEGTNHPKTGFSYKDMVYQPMVELVDFLHARDFKVYISTGSGADFLRLWVEDVVHIPSDHIIGSHVKLTYKEKADDTILYRNPEILFVNDGPNKPVGIHRFIGMKPILAIGNSDMDIQMLEYSQSSKLPNMQMLIHHTDSVREYAYGPQAFAGQLNIGLRLAVEKDWLIVDMAKDWNQIFIKR